MADYSITDTNAGFVPRFYKRIALAVLAVSLAVVAVTVSHASAVTAPNTRFDFTQAELNTNWGPERIAPSGGFSSVSAFYRNNVVKININSANASTSASIEHPYYWTEGIKTKQGPADNFSVPGNFGTSVSVDLFLDKDWEDTAVRAGLWSVGDNNAGGTNAANYPFGIIEFAHVSGYEGFRYYGSNGWAQVRGFHGYDKWATLTVSLDSVAHKYNLSVNGDVVATTDAPDASEYLYSVILNQRNFGNDPQTGLNEDSYSAHWHGGVVATASPKSKDDCVKDGWKAYGSTFKNQGQCVSSLVRNSNSKQ
ncbi:hypothetical protein H7Y63_03455 [Polaromonas sp.]|nr:hypothetical protein [Candidatus Saccharibacteria bacterium]